LAKDPMYRAAITLVNK